MAAVAQQAGKLGCKSQWLRVTAWLVRIALAAVFIYAGWIKLFAPAGFLQDVLNYQLVGPQVALWVVAVLPPLELLLGVCLLLRGTAGAASVLVAALCAVFLLALISAWARGLDISCGCFGKTAAAVSYPQMLLRDLLLIAAAVFSALISLRTER